MREENYLNFRSEEKRTNLIVGRRRCKEGVRHCVTTVVTGARAMEAERHDNGDGEVVGGEKGGCLCVIY